jgi:pantetheine-phosphate adenylyltransferase
LRICVCPGSFDPVTYGHIDIIERASKIFDKVIVVVSKNSEKNALFSMDERERFLKETCSHIDNLEIDSFSGLLVDYMKTKKASVIIKGLRAVSDFEYEFQMALMNRTLNDGVETLFMMTSHEYSYISSSLVKEVAQYGGDLNGLLPDLVRKELYKRYHIGG